MTDSNETTIEVESAYGKLSLTATKRDTLQARADDLVINGVHYRLSQPMYLHPEGTRVGSVDTRGWQHFNPGEWSGHFYMRRLESKGNGVYDNDPSSSARAKMIAELQRLCAEFPAELLERAERVDAESDIAAREAQIKAAEEFIEQMRAEIVALRAGGREEHRKLGDWSSSKHLVIVMPSGDLVRTRIAKFETR